MNWKDLSSKAIGGAVWIGAHWYVIAAVLIGIAVLIFVGFVNSCFERREEKKIANTKTNITVGKIESNIAANEVKNAETNTNNAAVNFNRSVRTDSNQYTGANADDKFCRRYPRDSTCAEWRRRQGLQSTP